jgi:polysaccharide export outer membrane protein
MSNRGQQTLLAAIWAVLGTCLASIGCETTMGPTGPDMVYQGQPGGGAVGQMSGYSPAPRGSSLAPVAGTATTGQAASALTPAACTQVAGGPGANSGAEAAPPPTPTTPGTTPPGTATTGVLPGEMPPPDDGHGMPGPGPLPRELWPSSHPPYTVAPPDILYIDSLRLIPRPPYRLEPLDQLQIVASGTLPTQPINGIYTVGPDGTVNLGFDYGIVRIAGLTIDQAQNEIRQRLSGALKNAQVLVTLVAYRGVQQTRGEHLVRQDGTIGLGTYGSLYVAGLTLGQIKCLLENHLGKWFLNPQVSVDVAAYNSKFYYVIADGGGFGQSVFKFPVTGSEYVLDAVANIAGLPPVASKRRIWVSRPAPCNLGCYQILPVDWRAITEGGDTCTNYQLFPGDRLFIAADRLIALDNWLSKIYSPIERTLGLLLLNNFTIQSFRALSVPLTSTTGTGFGFIGFR